MHALFDRLVSRAAKDAGQQLALDYSGEWRDTVLGEFDRWLRAERAAGRDEVVLEDFRASTHNHPASNKAWGALPRMACGAGLIQPAVSSDGSPKYRAARSVRTHAHPVRVWRVSV